MRWLTRHAKVLLAAYGVFLFLALLSPASTLQSESVTLLGRLLSHLGVPEAVTMQPRLEFIMNAVIIAPVPFLGYLLVPRYSWRDWTALGFVGALLVETLQALLLSGRNGSWIDVVANTLGALMGAGLAEVSRLASRRIRVP
jgi:glycopeptide antibiotics resistance protein